MTLEMKIAVQLHEDWREFKKNSDGTFKSVWHKIDNKDFLENLDFSNLPENFRTINNDVEIDMANSDFNHLSPDLQKEYYESAKVIADVLKERGSLTLDQVGERIYDAYLTRHPNSKKRAKTFEKLSNKRQNEILREYRVGLATLNETKINEKTEEKALEL